MQYLPYVSCGFNAIHFRHDPIHHHQLRAQIERHGLWMRVEHNGRRIPIPAGVSEAQFADKLKAYPAAALASQAPGGAVMLPGGRQMPVADFLAGLPDAQLEPVAPGRYGVRAGGGIVMGATGRPIIIEVR